MKLQNASKMLPKSTTPCRLLKFPEIPLNSVSYTYRQWHFLKRWSDIILAIAAMGVFAPCFLLIPILIKLSSRGPVLFVQERVTMGEKRFNILKFRTMGVDAESTTGPTWVKGEDDPRITPIGKFLRKSHLDELPQLWNVLKGDMSLIGPRPERPVFVAQFKAFKVKGYTIRHSVKPGITGLAQLLNPNPTLDQIQEKTDADLWYIQHWTPGLDFKIFVWSVLYALRFKKCMPFTSIAQRPL